MSLNSKIQTSNDKKGEANELVHRLHRVVGQLQGVERMMGEDKACLDVLHQLLAARSALGKIATKLLMQESCRTDSRVNKNNLEYLVTQLIQLQ